MTRLDYFDIRCPERAFSWTEGRPEPPGAEPESGQYLKEAINRELERRGLDASDIVSLQFNHQFGDVLCRVWWRRK